MIPWPLAAWAWAASTAGASGAGLPSEGGRTAALAGAVVAREAAGAEDLVLNPASLATLDGPATTAMLQGGATLLSFRRDGEAAEDHGAALLGGALSFGGPLPAGPGWVRALRVGVSAYSPAWRLLAITAPERRDLPTFPRYGDRFEHMSLAAGAALPVLDGALLLGAGAVMTPNLDAPTLVRYDPARGETADEHVVLHIDRTLRLAVAPTAGFQAALSDRWRLGAAWRAPVAMRAYGRNDTVAGALSVQDAIDFYSFFAPEEFAAGLAGRPGGGPLTVSLDVTRARWSEYRTIHNEPAAPRWQDVTEVRGGLEWRLEHGATVRWGWAFEPSPAPEQVGTTNSVDADRHVVGVGLGLPPWDGVAVSLHVRAHLPASRRAAKDPALVGPVVDNMGWPGWEGRTALVQAGVTVGLR